MAGSADMNDEAAEETIDPRVFIKQLAPDQLGVFELLSGLILLNISRAALVELGRRWAAQRSTEFDVAIIRTINHETYHFAQAAASGYVYHRQCRLFMVFNTSEPMPEVRLDPEIQTLLDAARADVGDDPELKLRYERTVAMLEGHNQIALLDARAAARDNSVMGALMPGFFVHLKALAEGERIANADGLSILGVLEGSAVAHTHLLMHPNDDATPHIEAELVTLPPVYRELYDLTVAHVGARALELLLPAVTLALRYAHPTMPMLRCWRCWRRARRARRSTAAAASRTSCPKSPTPGRCSAPQSTCGDCMTAIASTTRSLTSWRPPTGASIRMIFWRNLRPCTRWAAFRWVLSLPTAISAASTRSNWRRAWR